MGQETYPNFVRLGCYISLAERVLLCLFGFDRITNHESLLTNHGFTAALAAQRFQDLFLAFSPGASRLAFGISYSCVGQAYGAASCPRPRPRKRLLAAKIG